MKDVKDLHNENYKTLKKEIKDNRKWTDFPYLWISRINTVKMVI
jgi:ribosomal protein L20